VVKLRISFVNPKADDSHMEMETTIINQSQDPVDEYQRERDTGSFY
jgi:hypothetical protein